MTNKDGSTVNKSDCCSQSAQDQDDERSQEELQQIQDFLVGQGGESSEWSQIEACLLQSETNIKAFVSSKYMDILQADKASTTAQQATQNLASLPESQKMDKTTKQLQNVLCRQLQDIIEKVTSEFKALAMKRKHRYMILKTNADHSAVEIEKLGARDEGWSDFTGSIPKDSAR